MCDINTVSTYFSLPFLPDYVIEGVRMKNSNDPRNGEAIIELSKGKKRYSMFVELKDGKKEGVGRILRKDGLLFMTVTFVNDICEGEVIKYNCKKTIVLRGRLEKGKEAGIFTVYNCHGIEKWKGYYRDGKRFLELPISEKDRSGEMLSISEYANMILKEDRIYELEGGRAVREYEYNDGKLIRLVRKWRRKVMIEYGDNGKRVYEGGFRGNIKEGFVREREGTEYERDGKTPLYIGNWKNGLRDGYGSEFKGCFAVYIGEWKNGMRDGEGEEYIDNEEVERSERWIDGEYGETRQFENGYGYDLSVFDTSCLKGVTRLVIGDSCFMKVKEFVLDGLNELESVKIGHHSFFIRDSREGSKCLIMNCDRLRELEIGEESWQPQEIWERTERSTSSFKRYETLELRNLPSFISFRCSQYIFYQCHSIVMESEI